MIDIFEEQRLAEIWSATSPKTNIDLEMLTDACINGIKTCEGECPSRDIVGEHRCKCIRERFDCLETYELYRLGRGTAQKVIAAKGLSILIDVELANED